MMPIPLLFENFAAWNAQIAVLIAIGAIAALALSPGRARLIFWQTLLAIAMLLPMVGPWKQPAADDSASTSVTISTRLTLAPGDASRKFTKEDLLWIAVIGAGIRALWIALGFLRLRRHRLAALPLAQPPVPFEHLPIRWYVSDTISGPVTFGWLRPSILLPARVLALPADLRESIACHEMVHVERRDWVYVLIEEAVRAMFWFHPAVWFALARVQLAREQAVDSEVVKLMGNRERYLDALLAVAAQKFARPLVSYAGSDVAPAPLFLKKRQLAVRVAAVLKEKRMSKPRTFAGFATVAAAALIAARFAVWCFPLEAQALPQTPTMVRSVQSPDGPGVEVDTGGPILHRTGVTRPFGVATAGTVVLDATLNEKGEVTDARVISGPEELRRYVLQSVLQWHYSTTGGAGATARVTVNFGDTPSGSGQRTIAAISPVPVSENTSALLKEIRVANASPELTQKLTAALPVHIGDTVGPHDMPAILSAARAVDEHLNGSLIFSENNGVSEARLQLMIPGGALVPPLPSGGVVTGVIGGTTAGVVNGVGGGTTGGVLGGIISGNPDDSRPVIAYRDGQPATSSDVTPQRIRVGSNVQDSNLLTKVQPIYPPLAKQARIQGIVLLSATIGKDGTVQNLQVISGHPLLVQAAEEAAKQWTYRPTLLNGQPVEVITQININFSLAQ